MIFLMIIIQLPLFCLMGQIAREDAARLQIRNAYVWPLAVGSLYRVLTNPPGWAGSLLAALLVCGVLMTVTLLVQARRGKRILGGGDIKLLFALLLHIPVPALPWFLGILCVYILFLRLCWPEPGHLPLGPALCGAGMCLMIMY